MSTEALPVQTSPLDLVWVGDGAWVACDTRLADGDPLRVLAYLECKDHQVYVLRVRDQQDVCCYATLREALRVVAEGADPQLRAQPQNA